MLHQNKSVFFSDWVEKQIVFVNEQLMSYSEFKKKLNSLPLQKNIIFDAIPTGIIMLFKSVPLNLPCVSLLSPIEKSVSHSVKTGMGISVL